MIYLDNAATAKPSRSALARASRYASECFFNPSAAYREGFAVQCELKAAREKLVGYLADASYDLTFTSCGTEADNQAIFSFARRGNAVTSLGEHAAVANPFAELSRRGVETRFAALRRDGSVDVDSLLSRIDETTSFVSVIHVNNETGAINDVNAIARAVKAINPRIVFHTDGVQSFGKLSYRLGKEVDLYSFSAHKIGGLKGVGGLIRKKSLRLCPYLYGGGQEGGLRSGTENVFGIKVLEFAAEERYAERKQKEDRMRDLRTRMLSMLDPALFAPICAEGSPYILALTARGVRGEILLHRADDRGLLIGTGSACSSNAKRRYSRVILACGLDEAAADSVIRLSFCDETTEEELKAAAHILNEEGNALKEALR